MKKLLRIALATMLVVCTLLCAACGGGDKATKVSYAEFIAKAQQAQATDPGYTGGTISFYRTTTYFGVMEYEGGFTYENGIATLLSPENGNEHGRDESKWELENQRAWAVENKAEATYFFTKDGFMFDYAGTKTYYDSYGYFVKETHNVITQSGWLVTVSWTK